MIASRTVGRVLTTLAMAVVAAGLARNASAAVLDTYTADLDANWGGPIDQSGPAFLNGNIALTGNALTLSDSINTGAQGTATVSGSPPAHSFAFEYTFTVSALSSSDGTYASQVMIGGQNPISGLGMALYSGAGLNPTPLATGVAGSGATNGEIILTFANLVANQVYTLVVSGSLANGVNSANFAGAAQVSAVPLPSALLLFGTGLVGLAVVGGRGRRQRAAKV